MANASEITELFLFKPKHIPFMFGVLSRSLTKILEIISRTKAKRSQENEGIRKDKNLYVMMKWHSYNTHLGTRQTSCSLLQEMRMERTYIR
jgi:hypothetical protein